MQKLLQKQYLTVFGKIGVLKISKKFFKTVYLYLYDLYDSDVICYLKNFKINIINKQIK